MTRETSNSDESKPTSGPRIRVIKDDITMLAVDCIVYYARADLNLGTGFGSMISRRGGGAVLKELKTLEAKEVGEAVATTAGKLNARFIIHAVGPSFQEENIREKLKETVKNALACAEEKGVRNVAFPAMGTGFHGIPAPLSAEVMREVFETYKERPTCVEEIVVCVNDSWALDPYRALLAAS